MKRKFRRNNLVASGSVFLVFCFIIMSITSVVTYRRGLENLAEDGEIKLELFVTYLQGVLKAYESLPELLAVDDSLVSALLNPHQEKRIEKLNRYLETINMISDSADTYLMDREGLTIAASNWQEEHPFVGRNFSFRPYFVEAMEGHLGRYFALGTTSSKRGYYFAYPVRKDGNILGVVVIKINIDSVEQAWRNRGDNFIVTDQDSVVFLTTEANWRYHTMEPLEDEVERRIIESKRYPNASLKLLAKERKIIDHGRELVQIQSPGINPDLDHLMLTTKMSEAGWSVHILTDTKSVKKRLFWVNIMVGTALLLTYLLFLLLFQRRLRLAELSRIREKTRKTLQYANEKLELRVHERTKELTETNKLLRKEIQDRKNTEEKLKETRNELIHAAKMAVLGQMSASINHELNQPLAAIRSYTDNGKLFLQKGRYGDALWNLEQIGELTERMAQIGVQLKLFSRKTSGQITTVPLHGVIDGALEILRPTIRKADITIEVDINPKDLEVEANNVLLQQVLVNLISNGIQAVEKQDERLVRVVAKMEQDTAIMVITDNGPGISIKDTPNIFEPFFTTKKSGQGLGLGLTISERIIKDLGGTLTFLPEEGPGACFQIKLQKAVDNGSK